MDRVLAPHGAQFVDVREEQPDLLDRIRRGLAAFPDVEPGALRALEDEVGDQRAARGGVQLKVGALRQQRAVDLAVLQPAGDRRVDAALFLVDHALVAQVAAERHPLLCDRLVQHGHRSHGRLHIDAAQAVEPAVLDLRAVGRPRPDVVAERDRVDVSGEQQRAPPSHPRQPRVKVGPAAVAPPRPV